MVIAAIQRRGVDDDAIVTAAESTVNLCGFSGEATEDMRAVFEEAFPG